LFFFRIPVYPALSSPLRGPTINAPEDQMPKRLAAPLLLLAMLCLTALIAQAAAPAGGTGLEDKHIPDLALNGPLSPQEAGYLGLAPGDGPWKLSEIEADALLVEVFNMYCPHCQRQAPGMNELFRSLKQSPQAEKVKVIGVGAGNSAFEVDFFRKKYQVEFPLFTDQDFAFHAECGEPGTPFFMVLTPAAGGGWDVPFTHLGTFEDPAQFLDQAVQATGFTKTR